MQMFCPFGAPATRKNKALSKPLIPHESLTMVSQYYLVLPRPVRDNNILNDNMKPKVILHSSPNRVNITWLIIAFHPKELTAGTLENDFFFDQMTLLVEIDGNQLSFQVPPPCVFWLKSPIYSNLLFFQFTE